MISIVICTDGRVSALGATLVCLEHLDGPEFEVCVVHGPTEDGTTELLAGWHGRVKVARNLDRNLSKSRNIGISMSAGDIIAFIDDDGMPEASWLGQLVLAFDDPRVGAAGGIVMDHTGARRQYSYTFANRLGQATWNADSPSDYFNFPYSYNVPYVQGTNSAFRAAALRSIGGFDEEFEFYLDETDVCCRLVDAGWKVAQLSNAIVHHKFLPSAIRTNERVTSSLYSILKNKLYFSIVNNRGHYTIDVAIADMVSFVNQQETDLLAHFHRGALKHADLRRFKRDVPRAWEVGLARGLSGTRRLMPLEKGSTPSPALPFVRRAPTTGRETIVFVSKEYPPERIGGIGRFIHQAARQIATMGHHVHVVTVGDGHDRVDFEDRVWVHRIVPRPHQDKTPHGVPPHVWAHSSLMLDEVREIRNRQAISAVIAPIWDCEGIAFLEDRSMPLITVLQTTLSSWMKSHPHRAADRQFIDGFVTPVLELEKRLMQRAQWTWAISEAILRQVERDYNFRFDMERTSIVPLGQEDWSKFEVKSAVSREGPEELRLLFVGRLEERKGIDVLLGAMKKILKKHAHVSIDLVGDDTIPGRNGQSYRAEFECDPETISIRGRVRFHSRVTDAELRAFYRDTDIFVAPSRFESFGLVLLEAMMFGKPIVACRAGGMVEVVDDGQSAILAEPGDLNSLVDCIERLVTTPELRRRLGTSARERYEERFLPERMAEGVLSMVLNIDNRSGVLNAR